MMRWKKVGPDCRDTLRAAKAFAEEHRVKETK
jgi:hypothetical protein